MKTIIVVSFLFVFANALDSALIDEIIEKIQEFGLLCVGQENPPESDIEAMLQKEEPKTHEGKCTVFCVLKKMNLMKDAKTFGDGDKEWLEKVKADDSIFYDQMMNIYKICGEKVKLQDDGCENALELTRCSKNEALKKVAQCQEIGERMMSNM